MNSIKRDAYIFDEIEIIAIKEALHRENHRLKYEPPTFETREEEDAWSASAQRIIAVNERILTGLDKE